VPRKIYVPVLSSLSKVIRAAHIFWGMFLQKPRKNLFFLDCLRVMLLWRLVFQSSLSWIASRNENGRPVRLSLVRNQSKIWQKTIFVCCCIKLGWERFPKWCDIGWRISSVVSHTLCLKLLTKPVSQGGYKKAGGQNLLKWVAKQLWYVKT